MFREKVVGLFESQEEADKAIAKLQEAGFEQENVGLMARDAIVQRVNRQEDKEQGTIQAENKLGPTGGAAVGGATGLLIGAGAMAVPGVGPVLATGALATGLGAAAGGLLGALSSLGISKEEADAYAEGVKRGGILVVVQADESHAPQATRIMEEAGALDVKERRQEWEAEGWSGFDETDSPDEDYPPL